MGRAFTREEDNESGLANLSERPLSPFRNLVTQEGLALIDQEIAELRDDLASVDPEGDPSQRALLRRDLRYWVARRESAEVSLPEADSDVVRFGMSVTIERQEGGTQTWKIVGEDEANASQGTISHVSPMARALFGKKVGDLVNVNGREWEILKVKAAP